jgi:hypothetical protein
MIDIIVGSSKENSFWISTTFGQDVYEYDKQLSWQGTLLPSFKICINILFQRWILVLRFLEIHFCFQMWILTFGFLRAVAFYFKGGF